MNKNNKHPKEEGADIMNAIVQRPCSVKESIAQSCSEVKLIREGTLPKKTWNELREELKKIKGEEAK